MYLIGLILHVCMPHFGSQPGGCCWTEVYVLIVSEHVPPFMTESETYRYSGKGPLGEAKHRSFQVMRALRHNAQEHFVMAYGSQMTVYQNEVMRAPGSQSNRPVSGHEGPGSQ